jgi:hypothetical protein
MQFVVDFISKLTELPLEQLVGLIALAGLAVAFFALYVAYAVITQRSGK